MSQSSPAASDSANRPVKLCIGLDSGTRGLIETASSTLRRHAQVDASRHLLELAHAPEISRFDWETLFGDRNPVEFEIGSGKGLFLANAAASNPGRNYLGIEVSRKYAEHAALRLAKRAIPNARIIHGEARVIIEHAIPDRGLAAIHVYFPDPWWKTRHHKRRLVDEWLLTQIERTLAPGGEVFFATDVAAYFSVIERLMAARPRFERAPWRSPVDPELSAEGLTSFDRKYRAQGRSIDLARFVFAGQAGGVDETSS